MIHLYVLIEIIYARTCVSLSLPLSCPFSCFTFYYCYYVLYVYECLWVFFVIILCVWFSFRCFAARVRFGNVNDITKSLSFAAQPCAAAVAVALLRVFFFLVHIEFGPSIVSHCSSFNAHKIIRFFNFWLLLLSEIYHNLIYLSCVADFFFVRSFVCWLSFRGF